jgi:hypothetical protein
MMNRTNNKITNERRDRRRSSNRTALIAAIALSGLLVMRQGRRLPASQEQHGSQSYGRIVVPHLAVDGAKPAAMGIEVLEAAPAPLGGAVVTRIGEGTAVDHPTARHRILT